MNFGKISLIAASAILGISLMTGCGGGGGSSSAGGSSYVAGKALAAYRVDANAFLDLNNNGKADNNEPSGDTNGTGDFNITTSKSIADENYTIVITGGKNSETGVEIPYPIIAPKGFKTVSVISTIYANAVDKDKKDKVLKVLGVKSVDDIKDLDYNKINDIVKTKKDVNVSKLLAVKFIVETTLAEANVKDVNKVKTVAEAIAKAVAEKADENNVTKIAEAIGTEVSKAIDTNVTIPEGVISVVEQIANETNTTNLEDTVKKAEQEVSTITKKGNSLSIVDNKITIGGKTIQLENGQFKSSLEIDQSEFTTDKLFDISLELNDSNFVGNTTAQLALEIKSKDNKADYVAYIDKINVTKDNNGITTIEIPVGAKLYAYGVKDDGTPLYTEKTNQVANTFTEDENGTVELKLKDVFDNLNNSINTDLTTLLQEGNYTANLVVSGINVLGTKNGVAISDPRKNAPNKWEGLTGEGISGDVVITSGGSNPLEGFNKYTGNEDTFGVNNDTNNMPGALYYDFNATTGELPDKQSNDKGFEICNDGNINKVTVDLSYTQPSECVTVLPVSTKVIGKTFAVDFGNGNIVKYKVPDNFFE